MRRVLPLASLALALGAAPLSPAGPDWPQWRGPNRDGVVTGLRLPGKWPGGLKEEWKVAVGPGVASPVVVGGDVFVFTRRRNDELVLCLDLATGKEKWRSRPDPAPYKVGLGEGTADDRPRSTPAVVGGRVYTLGMTGALSCLDARTGALLWRKDCKPFPPYGGSSPLVADGLCVVHYGGSDRGKALGGLTAFDAVTGAVKWCFSNGSPPSSASPVLVTLAGERQVVTLTAWEVLGVSAATGRKLWSRGLTSVNGARIITPVEYRGLLLFADAQEPLRALRLERGPKGITAKEAWKAEGEPLYMSTPVLAGDLLFGMSSHRGRGGRYFCLDARSGKRLWVSSWQERMGNAALLNAGGALLFLSSEARLTVVRPTGKAFEPLAEYRVSDRQTWAHPVFLGDRILIRDDTSLRCFRLEVGGR